MAKYGAKCQETGVAVQHDSAIDPCHSLQNCAWDIEHPLLMQQVVELVLRTSDRMLAAIWQGGKQIGPRHQLPGHVGIIENNQQAAAAVFRQIESRAKQAFCKFEIPNGLRPEGIFSLGVRESPSAVPETEDLHSIGKNLHFTIGRKNHADMSAAQRGPAVGLISHRTGHR
jgi:hypothetical protein